MFKFNWLFQINCDLQETEGMVNLHNILFWLGGSSHPMQEDQMHGCWSINFECGIRNTITGLYFFEVARTFIYFKVSKECIEVFESKFLKYVRIYQNAVYLGRWPMGSKRRTLFLANKATWLSFSLGENIRIQQGLSSVLAVLFYFF